MHQKYNDYTPADLEAAKKYIKHCLQYELAIDFSRLEPEMIADLFIVKHMELSKYPTDFE